MSAKTEYKINKRSTYFTNATAKKKIRMWIPPHIEQAYLDNPDVPSIMPFVYYMETKGVGRIDTTLYENDFSGFYNFHLNQYSIGTSEFCSSLTHPGVNNDYIIQTANMKDCITLLSVDVDSSDVVVEVYALLTVRLIVKIDAFDTIMVETLCGNQSLPPSGEGTRLLNKLKAWAKEIEIYKIALHPIDNAVNYYTKERFRKLTKKEAKKINSSGSSSSGSSGSSSDNLTMQLNTKAISNWNKLKNSVKMLGIYKNVKTKRENLELQKKILQKKKSGVRRFTSKKGKPIPAPFTRSMIKFKPSVTPFKKPELSIKIEPGKTLKRRRMLEDIHMAEENTRR